MTVYNRIAAYFALVVVSVFCSIPAFAKEGFFNPAVGEVSSTVSGLERVVVGESGGLSVYAVDGSLVNSVVPPAGSVFVSSPLLVDVTNDGVAAEIIVVGRDVNNQYSLYAFGNGRAPLAVGTVTGTVSVEPVANGHDIYIVNTAGEVWDFAFANNAWASSRIVSVAQSAGIAIGHGGNKLFVNFPGRNEIWVYVRGANGWVQTATVRLTSAIVYPVVEDDNDPDILYGINAARQLVGFRQSTARYVTGFPVALPAEAVGGEILGEASSTNVGIELTVPFADGSTRVYSKAGRLLETVSKKSFGENSVSVRDDSQSGWFSGVHDFGIRMSRAVGRTITSIYSHIHSVLGSGLGAPSFVALTVRPSVLSDNRDIQVADVAYRVSDTAHPGIDTATIIIDRSTTNTLDMRGRFQYAPSTGFTEAGGNYFGNQYVRLLPQDATNSSAGSQVIPNPADGVVHYIYRWATDSTYGARATNTITYGFTAGSYAVSAVLSDQTFRVANAGVTNPTLTTIVTRPTVIADNRDVQYLDLAFRVNDVTHPGIDSLNIIIDRSTTNTLDMRGRFLYTSSTGFAEAGGNYFGNQYVRLLPQDATNSPAGSQVIQNALDGTVHYVYRWTLDPTYGDRAVNTITYAIVAGQYNVPAALTTSTFAVTH